MGPAQQLSLDDINRLALSALLAAGATQLQAEPLAAAITAAEADGIALDAEGCIWAASPITPGSFRRIAHGGAVLQQIDVADRAAFACALGGADRRTLFLLEASDASPPAWASSEGPAHLAPSSREPKRLSPVHCLVRDSDIDPEPSKIK